MNAPKLVSWSMRAAGAALLLAAPACSSTSTMPSATVSAIAVSPNPCVVGHTDSRQMSALATLPDGTKKDVTSDPSTTWNSDNTNTATVDPTGVVVGVNAGITTITATYQGASGDVKCTVGP